MMSLLTPLTQSVAALIQELKVLNVRMGPDNASKFPVANWPIEALT